MKRLSMDLTYPGASIDEVATMLGDPVFRDAVGRAQRVVEQQISIDGEPTGAKDVSIEHVHATTGVPGFAKKIVGDQTTIITKETWTSATDAKISVAIPGKPGEMNGTLKLSEREGSTVEQVTLNIEVKIPLVGGKIEGFLSDLMTRALEKENEVGRAWLTKSDR